MCWIINRTNVPGARYFDSLAIYGKTMPEFVKDFIGWVVLFNPYNGIMNLLFGPIFGGPIFNIFTPWGVVWALVFGGMPVRYLIVSAPVKNIDPALEEASRTYGPVYYLNILEGNVASAKTDFHYINRS